MTQQELLKLHLPTAEEQELLLLLETAKSAINARRYPFGDVPDELEKRYENLQIRIAVELFNKQGAEGETSHSENGISRGYSAAWISEELLSEITPKAGIL
ncbi:MAG: DNA-packaging protein [Lachnospiraceae bacterium]|nr:DNA-packaging protein [Ruminococcus sp.]MCM1277057.1 DNA-packaging protein [Lachnospiraceae bacterium]